MDRWISEFDHALRTVAGVHEPRRPSPAAPVEERQTSAEDRLEAAALMRVNHVGEVCAQALYQGQALTARTPDSATTWVSRLRRRVSTARPSARTMTRLS